jgi:hypothetical protein
MHTKSASVTLRFLAELVGAVLLTLLVLMALGTAVAWVAWH